MSEEAAVAAAADEVSPHDMSEEAPGSQPAQASEVADASSSPVVAKKKEALPEGVLTFKEHMWDRIDYLLSQRVERSQKLLEDMAVVLRARAQIERQYAQSLQNLPAQVQLQQTQSTIGSAAELALVNFGNRGTQSLELAEQIEQDIAQTFEEVAAQHKEVTKRVKSDVLLLVKYCSEARKQHSKLASRYGRCCADAEILAQDCMQASGLKSSERLALGKKVMTMTLQARAVEQEYYVSVEQANKAAAVWEEHVPIVLQTLQDMDENCTLCLKDGLRKLAVYETSWLRNLQYDLEASAKCAEDADPDADLQTFLRDCWEEQGQRAPETQGLPFCTIRQYYLCAKPKISKDTPERQLWSQDETYIQKLAMEEVQPLLKRLLAGPDGVKDEEMVPSPSNSGGVVLPTKEPDIIMHLRSGLDNILRRAALAQALRAEVWSQDPKQSQAEADSFQMCSVPVPALEALASVFVGALDACDEACDTWHGRTLMVLAQKFRSETEAGKPATLLMRIYSHKLWSKVTFWEEALVIGLCEAYAGEAQYRRSCPTGTLFKAPPMTKFLDNFVSYMLSFGIRLEQARGAVMSTIRKNSLLLGPMAKPYESLILQAHEHIAPATGGPADATGAMDSNDRGLRGAGGDDGGQAAQQAKQEEDFEAMALGLDSASQVSTMAPDSSADEATPSASGGGLGHSDEAFKALVGIRRSLGSVFE
eukprot:TRINITY_DN50361_c0_g1_i1.p1 TRINITY_DN50361_c0_g1~~TRINITY_DN50361_c0_g1_i1.p1  ORF type:complete len:706 (-),score=166.56 TRINITY_DN50361_c0_g1_i1:119-2236(-)